MPCRTEYYPSENDETRRAMDRLTRVSCDMRTILRRHGLERELTAETREWIREHDEWDRRRIAEEEARGERQRIRQRAIDKLNLEERRVLGL